MPLTESELKSIREEAEKMYPYLDAYGKTLAKREGYIAAMTKHHAELQAERERVKELVDVLEDVDFELLKLEDISHGLEGKIITAARVMIQKAISNHSNNQKKEATSRVIL